MMSHAMRQEMKPLGVHVTHVCSFQTLFLYIADIDLVAKIVVGIITTNCWDNMPPKAIPETSLYFPIKDKAEALMTPAGSYISASEFAEDVFGRLLKPNPPALFRSGSMTWPPRIVNFMVTGGVGGLNDLAKIIGAKGSKKKAA
jgi:hypothetical protein